MSIQIGEPPKTGGSSTGTALFALGFRPFFLVAGLSALVLSVIWLLLWQGVLPAIGYFDAYTWHAHEMLFGYVASVVAGFLLTAVRNWTGMVVPTGGKLAVLAGIWLLARILILVPGVPHPIVASVDMVFLPLVAVSLFQPLWNGQNKNNRYFLLLFLSMTLANLMFHLDVLGIFPGLWQQGAFLMLDTVLLTLLLVAGRVVPFFTEKAVAGSKPTSTPWIEKTGFILMILLALFQLIQPNGEISGVIAVLLGGLQVLRLAGWYHKGIWRIPVLWVLYTGYAWLVVGLILRGLASFEWLDYKLSLHALTVGAIGIVTLGMMPRVALGHTGRDINTSKSTNVAFVLMNLSVIFRVLLPLFIPAYYIMWIHLSGTLWILAFTLFVFVYMPILIWPRVDGRPG